MISLLIVYLCWGSGSWLGLETPSVARKDNESSYQSVATIFLPTTFL